MQSIKLLYQEKIKHTNVTNLSSWYYRVIANIDKFSSQNAVNRLHLKALVPEIIKSNSLPGNPLYAIYIRKFPVNSSKWYFINTGCISKISGKQSLKIKYPTFKIMFSNWITYANSLIKTLFPYNCKNIFVHFFEETILLFRSDNKTRFPA